MHGTSTIMAAIAGAALLLIAPARPPARRRRKARRRPQRPRLRRIPSARSPGTRSPATGSASSSSSIRRQWGRLTDNEVQIAKGNREALNGYIQVRYGIDREKADRQIDDWLKTLK